MSDLIQAIVLAVIQGVTELFPVSSLGHAVILPHLFGWTIETVLIESFSPGSWVRSLAFVKVRSGTRDHPVPQKVDCKLGIAIETPAAP